MLNPYIIIAALIGAAALFGSGVSVGKKWEEGQRAREEVTLQNAVQAAAAASAEAIAKIKVVNKTIENEVRYEVEKEVVYRDCKLTPRGVQLANQALAGTQPAGDSELPKVDAPIK